MPRFFLYFKLRICQHLLFSVPISTCNSARDSFSFSDQDPVNLFNKFDASFGSHSYNVSEVQDDVLGNTEAGAEALEERIESSLFTLKNVSPKARLNFSQFQILKLRRLTLLIFFKFHLEAPQLRNCSVR